MLYLEANANYNDFFTPDFILVILHYKKHHAICSHQEDTPVYQRPIQKDFWGAFTLRQLDLPTLFKYSLLDYGYISYYKKID